MTKEEAGAILGYAAGLDGRLQTIDKTQAEFTKRSWANALSDVPADFAMSVVTDYYRNHSERAIAPGMVLLAWRNAERTEAAREPVAETVVLGRVAPDWFASYKTTCDEAANWPLVYALRDGKVRDNQAREARARVIAVSPPVFADEVDARRDARERRCVNHDICACDHRECRDGWLEGDEVRIVHGAPYPRISRCPACEDAVKMREELKPHRRRGRR